MDDTTNWLCDCGTVLTSRTFRDHKCPDEDEAASDEWEFAPFGPF